MESTRFVQPRAGLLLCNARLIANELMSTTSVEVIREFALDHGARMLCAAPVILAGLRSGGTLLGMCIALHGAPPGDRRFIYSDFAHANRTRMSCCRGGMGLRKGGK
jgi:hypothetical protein